MDHLQICNYGHLVMRLNIPRVAACMMKEFRLAALETLAKIVADVYYTSEITDLFRKAGFDKIKYDYSGKQEFLYAAFEDIQKQFGSESIITVLKAVCNPESYLDREDLLARVRNDVNKVLIRYSIGIDENGEVRPRTNWKHLQSLPKQNETLFQQRKLHPDVVQHSKKDFIRGEYSSAVFECCKAFETFVRERSGIQEKTGADLMLAAFSEKNPVLKISMSSVSQQTRTNMQRGLMQLCAGLMSGIRNSVGHETKANLPMEMGEALDILTLISYLVRQVYQCNSTRL